jgi:lycopene beta-cyclase
MSSDDFDYAIVGGGLQGCLLAHAIARHCPDARTVLIERSEELCGSHTWSFHESDIPPEARGWFDPLVSHRWPGYLVRFPGHSRRIDIPYATITSDGLRESTMSLAAGSAGSAARLPLVIRTGTPCEIAGPTQVILGGGQAVQSRAVIDCRGLAAVGAEPRGAGFQSFIGREYAVDRCWPASEPTVMDVPVDQTDGFEFLYELPFGPHRVLLEYTRFHEDPACDPQRADQLIAARLADAGVDSAEVLRTERGCLPMPYARAARGHLRWIAGGYAGGWYHAATGYSMPLAIRFAELVARSSPERIAAELASAGSREAIRHGFARILNRLLFCLVEPKHRWKIFRRFYRVLPEERIARFYGHRFTVGDAARIVIGRPPTGLTPLRFARSFLSA